LTLGYNSSSVSLLAHFGFFPFADDHVQHGFTINNVSFVNPTLPVLLQVLSGVPPERLLPAGSVYTLPMNKIVQITFPMTAMSGNAEDAILLSAPVCHTY
jgi:hypothetical protein